MALQATAGSIDWLGSSDKLSKYAEVENIAKLKTDPMDFQWVCCQ